MELFIKNQLKSVTFLAIALALVLTPLLSAPTASAATTTTKYFNGKAAYISGEDGGPKLYDANSDGTSQRKLSELELEAPSYSPDGTKIAFIVYGNSNSDIYVMNADGSNVTNLTNGQLEWPELAYNLNPWSPDSAKILFTSYHEDSSGDMYTMNTDGSNKTNLTSNPGIGDIYPLFSPDGSKIVFSSRNRNPSTGGCGDMYSMNANGSGVVRLTSTGISECPAAWSPDGSKILFSSSRDNPNKTDVYTMNADGSSQTNLTNSGAYEPIHGWSPDGSKILFSTDGINTLYTMNPDGSNKTAVFISDWVLQGARFSPDSTKIIYANKNNSAGNYSLFTMNADGSNKTEIKNSNTYLYYVMWQPLPYTVVTNDNGTTTSTIPAGANYSTTDYTVVSGETLVLDGSLCDVTVQSGGTLQGTGSIAPNCTLIVEPGGVVAPGHSPGCLASGNLVLSGTLQAEIAGTAPCTGYDQLQVTGTVNLTNATLTPSLLNGFVPKAGDSFTLIQNDATDSITNTFQNLPEGSTLTVGTSVFKISYVGGDGNDVTLTAQTIPGVPETGWGSGPDIATTIFAGGGLVTIISLILRLKYRQIRL